MKFEFTMPTKPKRQAVAQVSLLTGSCRLWIEGEEMPYAGRNKKIFTVNQGKKNSKTLRLQPNIFNMGLTVIYGGKRTEVTPKLGVVDYIIGYMPFILGLFAASYFEADGLDSILIGVSSVFLSLFNLYMIRRSGDRKMQATLYNIGIIGGAWGLYYLICKII